MDRYLKYSFGFLLAESILMETILPASGSILKILITLLVYVSFLFALVYALKRYKMILYNTNSIAIKIFLLLMGYNIISIARSLFNGQGQILTALGNIYTSLSLLIPIVLCFGIFKSNLIFIRKSIIYLLIIGILFSPLAIPFLISKNYIVVNLYTVLFLGNFFLLPTILYEKINIKRVIIISSLIMLVLVIPDSRASLLREILLLLAVLPIYLYQRFKVKTLIKISIFALFIPVFFMIIAVTRDIDIFQTISETDSTELSTDTRSFLYREVIIDLVSTNQLIFGKGANSTYFSQYFYDNGGDTDTRLTVEVGLLAIILKGGIVGLILNLSLFVYAITLSFYQSNNYYVLAMGYLLLIHVILLFVENLVAYSIYNYIIWFCVGLCLNNQLRALNNKEIKKLLYGKIN